MNSNISSQAANAVADMRTLPLLPMPTDVRGTHLLPTRVGATAPARLRVQGTAMSTVATYRAATNPTTEVCAVVATDSAVIAWGKDADHKFSTRLGPSASPPM